MKRGTVFQTSKNRHSLMVTNNSTTNDDSTAVMLSLLNNTLKDVAKRVSRIEANQARPSKRQRKNESLSYNASSEDGVSDSEKLVGKIDTVATSGTQASDMQREKPSDSGHPLLSEIAQDFDCGDDTCPNVSEKLAKIVNTETMGRKTRRRQT